MVGQVEWVNAELLRAVMAAGTVPVIAPIARDPAGGKLNINADSVAGHVAAALRAEKIVLVSDTHGIRTDPEKDETASTLTRDETDGLIRSGVIAGGMLPKVEAALTALGGGCRKAAHRGWADSACAVVGGVHGGGDRDGDRPLRMWFVGFLAALLRQGGRA